MTDTDAKIKDIILVIGCIIVFGVFSIMVISDLRKDRTASLEVRQERNIQLLRDSEWEYFQSYPDERRMMAREILNRVKDKGIRLEELPSDLRGFVMLLKATADLPTPTPTFTPLPTCQ